MFLGQTTLPLDDVDLSSTIDRAASDYTDTGEKFEKIRESISTGNYDADIARYIPGVLKSLYFKARLKTSTQRKSYKCIL